MEADTPPPPVATDTESAAEPRKKSPAITAVIIALPLLLLLGGVAALLGGTGAGDALVYSKKVNEVLANPAAWQTRELRVEGDLKQGSVQFRQSPCEWRFTLSKAGRDMPVRFPQCVVPDTFRDGMGITVTVQGRLQHDGSFLANQVIPRCPSKYEMQQRQHNGEKMPHAATSPMADRT